MLQAPFGPVGPGWMTMSTPSTGFGITPAVDAAALGAAPFVGQAPAGGVLLGQSLHGWGMSPVAQTPLSAPFSIPEGITASVLLTGIALRRGQPQGRRVTRMSKSSSTTPSNYCPERATSRFAVKAGAPL